MAPDDVTSDWLSAIFDAAVSVAEVERIGDGLVGMNVRVQMTHDVDGVPASVVIKLPSPDETSRATGIALRNYEREVRFYREIADTVAIRVPRCWHADWDAESGDFVLVLEDMAPAQQGDQITGCSPDLAVAAVSELARLHGPRWDDPALGPLEWLSRRTDGDVAQLEGLWQMFFPGFVDTYGRYLSANAHRLVDRFGSELTTWVQGRTGPLTVTHGDYRLDNLLFGMDVGSPPVTAVDWQTPGHAPGPADLSYFCGAGLLPEDRRAHERALVSAYADALGEFDIDLDRTLLWEQYSRESFAGVIMAVIASQVVGSNTRSEAMFAAMASRHLQHALDLDALDLVV